MTKTIFALAALAAIGFSGVAFADEATTTNGPAAMTDAEMDKATAGLATIVVKVVPPGDPTSLLVAIVPGDPPAVDNKAVTITPSP